MKWLIAAVSLLPLWAALRTDHRLLGEDPLITLTYAKNLAHGHGFVFNHPPPLLGTTTPLFALVVAGLERLLPSADLTEIAVWLSAGCWIAVLWMFVWFKEDFRLSSWQVLSIVGAVTATGWATRLEFEAYLFAALLVLSIGFLARGRPLVAGVLAALLFLTRGEGLLLFPVLAVVTSISDLRDREPRATGTIASSTARLSLGFGIPMLVWAAYALPTFGGVLPIPSPRRSHRVPPGCGGPFPVSFWRCGSRVGRARSPCNRPRH